MAKHKPEPEPEIVADESTLQTGTSDETLGPIEDYTDRLEELAAILAAELEALDAQDPIIYRYNGNATTGERLLSVPLADIRQSLWTELPKWVQTSVTKSHLYAKVEGE